MSRFLALTSDTDFERRVQSAIAGVPGALQVFPGTDLPPSPELLMRYVVGELPEIVILGPGLPFGPALALAEQFDRAYPELALVLVDTPTHENTLAAMRVGVRDILPPDADVNTVRLLLDHLSATAQNRRRAPAQAPQLPAAHGQVITVVSPKGGAGKTTVAANLAVGLGRLAPMGTVLVDLDVQFGDVATVLGLDPEHSVLDAVGGAAAVDPMLMKAFLTPHPAGLYALCTPRNPADGSRITGDQVGNLIAQLAAEFRFVVIDSAPGLSEHSLAALEHTTDVVAVSGMDVPGVRSMRKALELLEELHLMPERRHFVLNFAEKNAGLTVTDVEITVGAPVDVLVPRSPDVAYATNRGVPVLQDGGKGPAVKALQNLVNRFDPSWSHGTRRKAHRRLALR